MRKSVILGSFVLFAACGGGGGKSSADELGKAVVSALGAKDQAALNGLVAKVDAAIDACPALGGEREEIEKQHGKAEKRLGEALTKCGELDWSKVTVKAVNGGEAKKPIEGCADLVEGKDIEVVGELDGKEVTVKIDDPVIIKGKYYLFDGIKCRGGGKAHPAVAVAIKAADDGCACKDVACAAKVTEQYGKDMADASKAEDGGSEEDAKAITDATKRLTDCMTKLSQ